MAYTCYLLNSESNPNHTYIGITNNPEKRLKQHNGIISGGAKATRKFDDWEMIQKISLIDKSTALRFEYQWKRAKGRKARLEKIEELKKLFKDSIITPNNNE